MTESDPRGAHQQRLEFHQRRRDEIDFRLDRIGLARLIVAAGGFALLILVILKILSPYWLALPVLAIVALSVWYSQLKMERRVVLRAEAYHQRGLARLDDNWVGTGDPGSCYLDESHLYAADLDLFGVGSLFERVCTAHTRGGQDMLASWLREPADPATIRARQQAIADLRDRFDLRERLALLGEAIPGGFETEPLADWAGQTARLPLKHGTILVHVFTLAIGLSLVGMVALGSGIWPFLLVVALQSAFVIRHFRATQSVLSGIEKRAGDLVELSGILYELETQSFTASRLRELQGMLQTGGEPPSRQIGELLRLIDLLNSRRNQLFLPIALLLMWGTRMAFRLDAWRVRSGPAMRRWFAVIAELEALLSLSALAFENPSEPFPEIVESGRLYDASQLRHPLMKRNQCVPNDLHLGDELQLLVVSGSNMSGKSTFLRTAGINAVLAFAGAPVFARTMRIAPLTMGATLRIQDSLMAGKSRFFAEITRIRQVMERTKESLPLFFLFDEVLAGTNSHDRGIGSAAIIRALVERGALGLVTTHDLALAHVADELAPRAANVHFADHLEDGQMMFDYRMQPGVVRHSNAIALMRAVGLPV